MAGSGRGLPPAVSLGEIPPPPPSAYPGLSLRLGPRENLIRRGNAQSGL